jgi:hypothetical protein
LESSFHPYSFVRFQSLSLAEEATKKEPSSYSELKPSSSDLSVIPSEGLAFSAFRDFFVAEVVSLYSNQPVSKLVLFLCHYETQRALVAPVVFLSKSEAETADPKSGMFPLVPLHPNKIHTNSTLFVSTPTPTPSLFQETHSSVPFVSFRKSTRVPLSALREINPTPSLHPDSQSLLRFTITLCSSGMKIFLDETYEEHRVHYPRDPYQPVTCKAIPARHIKWTSEGKDGTSTALESYFVFF